MSVAHLGFELGMAVSEYNNGTVATIDEIVRYTILYIQEVKKGIANDSICADDIADYYLVIGQAWASIVTK